MVALIPWSFDLPIKIDAPLPLKNEAPFQEMIPRKKSEKLETAINTCASHMKQH